MPPNYSVTSQNIANALDNIAGRLESLAQNDRYPRAQRHLCLRYAAFALELAQREIFCQALAGINITTDMTYPKVAALLWPFTRYIFLPQRLAIGPGRLGRTPDLCQSGF